jgi:glycine/D-amino acid oxidase-like deaminating enzyme
VNLPDKRPVAGVHPEHPRVGVLNGLGAKGTLLAPILAQQWTKHLKSGAPFSAEVDVQRFWRHNSSQALAL